MSEPNTCLHRLEYRRRDESSPAVARTHPNWSRTAREMCTQCGLVLFEQTTPPPSEPIPEAEYIEGLRTILPQREEPASGMMAWTVDPKTDGPTTGATDEDLAETKRLLEAQQIGLPEKEE